MAAFIKQHHQRSRFRGQGESLFVPRNGNVVELGSRGGGDFDFDGDAEEANAALDLLSLFNAHHYLMLLVVVGVAQVKFRRACSVQPLAEELVDIGGRGLFDSFGEIGGSQMSPQSLQVTRSPNHWCPSSCEIKSSSPVKYSGASLG